MAEKNETEAKDRISEYVICHLGQAGEDLKELTDEIEELRAHPDRNSGVGKHLELLNKLAREKLDYIVRRTIDLAWLGQCEVVETDLNES